MNGFDLSTISGVYVGNTQYSQIYYGSSLIWPVSPLPAGYTQLEYIESTQSGGQYIDLNIKLYEVKDTLYDIAIKFNMIGRGKDNSSQFNMFNCQDPNSSPWPGTMIRVDDQSSNQGVLKDKVVGRYIGGTDKDNFLGDRNTIIELPVQTPPNKNVTNIYNNNRTHLYHTTLFSSTKNTNGDPYRFAQARLYYFKLFVEGVLVRDLIPCKDSNNVVGMYDIVNNVFYTSPNGAAFIAGPEV